MLKANGARLLTNACRCFGGNSVAGIYGLGVSALRGNTVRANGALFNFVAGEHTIPLVTDRAAIPEGYEGSGAYVLARKAGGLASRNEMRATSSFSGTMTKGGNVEGSFAALSSWSASGQLVVSLSGQFQGASLFDGSVASTLAMNGTFLTASTFSAGVSLIVWATGNFAASYTMVGNLRGTARLEGSFPGTSDGALTAEAVAAAVWAATAVANNNDGTMGERLNSAGAAADPWSTVIEGTFTAEELLKLMAAALLGKATATSTTYTVRDLRDAVDRITATVDADGNRTAVVLDPS